MLCENCDEVIENEEYYGISNHPLCRKCSAEFLGKDYFVTKAVIELFERNCFTIESLDLENMSKIIKCHCDVTLRKVRIEIDHALYYPCLMLVYKRFHKNKSELHFLDYRQSNNCDKFARQFLEIATSA